MKKIQRDSAGEHSRSRCSCTIPACHIHIVYYTNTRTQRSVRRKYSLTLQELDGNLSQHQPLLLHIDMLGRASILYIIYYILYIIDMLGRASIHDGKSTNIFRVGDYCVKAGTVFPDT